MWVLISLYLTFISWIIFLANTGKASSLFDIVHTIPYGDKYCHALLYGFLAMLLNIAFNSIKMRGLDLGKLFGSFCVLLFSSIEEYSQHFISARSLDMLDLVANILGIAAFSLITLLILKEQKITSPQSLF